MPVPSRPLRSVRHRCSCLAILPLCWLLAAAAGTPAEEPPPPPLTAQFTAPQIQREIVQEGFRARIDASRQVLRIDTPKPGRLERGSSMPRPGDNVAVVGDGVELRSGRQTLARLTAGQQLPVLEVREGWVRMAVRADGQTHRGWVRPDEVKVVGHEDPVRPTLSQIGSGRFVSQAVLAQKAKQFDDGLYAAVDLAAQSGAGLWPGKVKMLEAVAGRFEKTGSQPLDNAAMVLLGAAQLGKLDVQTPPQLQQPVATAVAEFMADAKRSKPIGFYTWSEPLERIFRQDRMLQTELKGQAGIAALVETLAGNPDAASVYSRYLDFVGRLTNPLAYPDLRPSLAAWQQGDRNMPAKEVYFFPPSVSHETELLKKLFPENPVPPGFSLIDELIARIQDGRIDLTPTDASGWYDYQTWAQEPLVIPDRMPEAKRLVMDDRYREQLLELFKGVLALTRETHIKQLEIPVAPSAEPPGPFEPPKPKIHFTIRPELAAEPMATVYLRRAMGYRFVRGVLEETFGRDALGQIHRQSATGPVRENLDDELRRMEALFFGAYVAVSRQLGMPPETTPGSGSGEGPDADAVAFLAWSDRLQDDPDVGRDVRMMVPVFYDDLRKMTKVWVFLGWQPQQVRISFAQRPAVEVFDPDGQPVPADSDRIVLHYHSQYHTLAYPVTAEVYVTKILNRPEFRAHCDKYKTRSAILANLE